MIEIEGVSDSRFRLGMQKDKAREAKHSRALGIKR